MATYSLSKASRDQRFSAKLDIPTNIFTALLEVEQRNTLPYDTPRGIAWLRSEQRNDFLMWFVKICRRRVYEEFVDDHGRRTVEQIRFTCIATLFSAVSYMDRILSKIYVEKLEFAKVQPVLVACLLLASKIHDGQEIGVFRKILEHVEDNMTEFTVEELLEYETRILLELDLKLDEPTIVDFMKLQQIGMGKMGKSCAHLFAIQLLFEPQFLYGRRPSVLATAIMTIVYPNEGFCTWFGDAATIEEVENEVAKLTNELVIGLRTKGFEPLKWAPPALVKVTDRKILAMCADLVQDYELRPVVETEGDIEESLVSTADDEARGSDEVDVPLPAPTENGRKRRRASVVKGTQKINGVEKMDTVQEQHQKELSSAGKRVKKLDGGASASSSTVPPEFTPPKTSVSDESMNSMSNGAVVELVKTGAQSPSNREKKYYHRR